MLRLLFVEADDLAAVGATFFVGALDAIVAGSRDPEVHGVDRIRQIQLMILLAGCCWTAAMASGEQRSMMGKGLPRTHGVALRSSATDL
jgi:hypothetical protein